jgi:transposase
MSLPLYSQENLFAAGNELSGFLPDDDPMMIFSRQFYPCFTDQEFEDCYSQDGRPAVSPRLLACVTLLQFREHLSDVEAAAAVIRRLDWKIALHRPIYENTSFDPSTLCYFRRRLKENGKMRLLFERTIEVAQALGLIRKHMSQRVDATHVISHVNRISTTDLLARAVRCLVEEVGPKAPEVYEAHLPEYLKERYTNRFSSFAIRPFVVGRRNWLFSGSPRGAHASATLFSLIETAKCNGLEPYRYLRYLFTKLPLVRTHDEYRSLTPHLLDRDDFDRVSS